VLPREIARAARADGRGVFAVAFRGITDADLASHVDEIAWLELGQLDALLERLRGAGVADAVMAGKVSKQHWLSPGPGVPLRPDARALRLLSGLTDRRDDALLRALADALAEAGVTLLPQAGLVPELVPGPGVLGRHTPDDAMRRDVACGWRAARGIAALDVGQTAVAREGAVLALEAVEGTDEAIRRGGRLGGPGGTAVKVARPAQDPRFDLPAIGPGTLEAVFEAGVVCLAFEAEVTLVLERPEMVAEADRRGVVLLGVPREGPDRADRGSEGCGSG